MRALVFPATALILAGCSGSSKGVGTQTGGNVAPVIASVELTPEPAFEATLLNCTATGVTDADGDAVTLTYAWTVSGTAIAATTATLGGADFDKGDQVSCTVTPDDGGTLGVPVSSNTVIIENSPPTAIGVDVSPNPATPLDTLLATPTGWSDADPADGEDWRFAWFVNGVAAGTGSNSLAGEFVKGDQVYVVATPFDGTDLGDPVQSDVVNILNTPPVLASVELTPFSPLASDVLTCTPINATDQDGDPITFQYAWYVNNNPAGSGTDILAAPQFASGDTVYCVVTPNDGTDDGAPVQSNSVVVGNAPPVVGSVSLTPDPATELDILSCTPNGLFDPDGDPITVSFSWSVQGLTIPATGSTLTGADFDKGDPVVCTVTASDGIDTSPPAMSNVVVIANTPPAVSSGLITPDPLYTLDDAMVVAYGWSDIDGDPEGYTYQWFKNGLALPGAIGDTLLAANFAKHDLLSVEITAFDGEDPGNTVTTPVLEVQNTPPTAPVVQITPSSPDTSEPLLCGLAVLSSDDDLDPISYSYSWTKNGVPTAHTSNTVPASDTTMSEVWACFVTPNDGETDGPAGTDSAIIVDGIAPDPPILDPIDRYRNFTLVDLTGTSEPNAVIEITATCDMGSSGMALDTADPLGFFAAQWTMVLGETCSFQATATDAGNNTSLPSNVVTTTVCSSPDPWEGGGYGDTSLTAVDEWGPILDDGLGSILLEGNILDQDPGDWFVVYGADDPTQDAINGSNQYDFTAVLTAGAPEYTFLVYRGSVSPATLECPTEINGYDTYNDYYTDRGDAPDHAPPLSPDQCGPLGSSTLNECEDMGTAYFIQVLRDPAAVKDCTPYAIQITNNAP